MNVLEAVKSRRSVRKYSPREIEKEKLDMILAAANAAPTAANRQPVRLIIAREKESLKKIGRAADIYGAPLAVIVCSDTERAWKRPYDGKSTSDIDAAILTDHMMLTAASLGLGSVWICWFDPAVLRAQFDIPDNFEPVNILAIGYPDENTPLPAASRIPISELVHYEQL